MIFQDLNNIDQIKRKIFKDFDIDLSLEENNWIDYIPLINCQNNKWSYKDGWVYIKSNLQRSNVLIAVQYAFDANGDQIDEIDLNWICRQKDNCILLFDDCYAYESFYVLNCDNFLDFESYEKKS